MNHVPKGEMPNVLQCPYDYPSDPLGLYEFPKRLRKYVPNSYAKRPTTFGTIDRSAFMHGMVLITARPLNYGDELLMVRSYVLSRLRSCSCSCSFCRILLSLATTNTSPDHLSPSSPLTNHPPPTLPTIPGLPTEPQGCAAAVMVPSLREAVSYTHLTLPTICSV